MTYDAGETALFGGEPVELYEFRKGPFAWRYTSADEAFSHIGQTFEPYPIRRSGINVASELNKMSLDITVPRDCPVASLFRIQPPGAVVSVSVYRRFRGDSETVIAWQGRVLSVQWKGEANLKCESIASSAKRLGLRRRYAKNCPHVLYDGPCGVVQTEYQVSGTVLAVSGNSLTVAEAGLQADGYYDGGFVYWQTPGGLYDWRMIETQVGAVLTINFSIVDMAINDTVYIYPGCKRTLDDCNNKFNNGLNYGGWPYIPHINPFDGTLIY